MKIKLLTSIDIYICKKKFLIFKSKSSNNLGY